MEDYAEVSNSMHRIAFWAAARAEYEAYWADHMAHIGLGCIASVHPPEELPYMPCPCVLFPDDKRGYGHEVRAGEVTAALYVYIHNLRTSLDVIIYQDHVQNIASCASQTVPLNPRNIYFSVHAGLVSFHGALHYWFIAEAYDISKGHKYFRCWRNRQTVFPVIDADGILIPKPSWPEISDGLLQNPLASRCHGYRCRLPLLPVSKESGEVLVSPHGNNPFLCSLDLQSRRGWPSGSRIRPPGLHRVGATTAVNGGNALSNNNGD